MKKSLLVVAAMFAAVCANAQGSWTNTVADGLEKDAVAFAAGTVLTEQVPGMTIKLAGATDWAVKGLDPETFTGADGITYSKNYIQGGTNGTSTGLMHSSGESSHIQFTVEKAGTVYVAAKFGNNKPIWAAKVATAEVEELDISDMSAYLYTYEGKYIKDDGTYGGDEAATEAQYAALPLAVEPGYTYFFWVSGSKLMLSGINFTTGASGISTVKAAAEAEGTIYNIAGQKVAADYKGLVIKNGKKFIQK